MSKWRIDKAVATAMRRYRSDNRGTMSVELVLILPVLFWGYVAMMIFYDAYRARMEAQSAALHVADLISRTAAPVTDDYFEGLNDVYDFLTSSNRDTRLRISSLMWVVDDGQEDIAISWSYGTRGLPSLVDLSLGSLGGDDGQDGGTAPSGFGILDNQFPVADLEDRIPTVLPGEALILVEAFTLWRGPVISWFGFDFLNDVRLAPIAVTRPRFSPFIRYDGVDVVYPEIPPDFFPAPGDPPPPEVEEEPEPDSTSVTIVDTDFTDGDTDGWSESTITTTSTQTFFGPFGRETRQSPVTYQVNLGAESRSAQIEFDLYIIDSWDGYDTVHAHPEGEFLTIEVNGSSIALEHFLVWLGRDGMRNDRRTVASRAEGRFTTTMTLIESGTNTWGNSWNDQVWRVVIDVENPVQTFALGFSANLDEPIDNESFGLRNFRITAERGEHGPAHFVPNAQRRLGEDQFTRFTQYTGCPDLRLAGHTKRLFNSDLERNIRMRRTADGVSRADECGIPGAMDFITASPVLILDYENNTSDIHGNRLRIQTEDNNNGNSCDATLLIRDPYGQWAFNSEISWGQGNDNYNARINLGHAPSGTYHIWMGNFDQRTCATDLSIRRY